MDSAGISKCSRVAVAATEFDHGVWNGLLQNYVQMINHGQASQVDYDGFLQKRVVLRNYLSQLSAVNANEFSTWSQPERFAFLINTCNAKTRKLEMSKIFDWYREDFERSWKG